MLQDRNEIVSSLLGAVEPRLQTNETRISSPSKRGGRELETGVGVDL